MWMTGWMLPMAHRLAQTPPRVLFFSPPTSLSWWSSSFWPLILPCDGSPLQDAPLSRMCHLSRTVRAQEVRGPWRPRAPPRAVATRAYRAAWWRPDRIILVLEQKLGRENRGAHREGPQVPVDSDTRPAGGRNDYGPVSMEPPAGLPGTAIWRHVESGLWVQVPGLPFTCCGPSLHFPGPSFVSVKRVHWNRFWRRPRN